MSYTITFPSRRAFVEWRLRELQPEVERVRQGCRSAAAALVASSAGLLLALLFGCGFVLRWTFLSVELVFAAVLVTGLQLHGKMRKEFQALCYDRLCLMQQEAYEVEQRRYEELVRRMSSGKGGER